MGATPPPCEWPSATCEMSVACPGWRWWQRGGVEWRGRAPARGDGGRRGGGGAGRVPEALRRLGGRGGGGRRRGDDGRRARPVERPLPGPGIGPRAGGLRLGWRGWAAGGGPAGARRA